MRRLQTIVLVALALGLCGTILLGFCQPPDDSQLEPMAQGYMYKRERLSRDRAAPGVNSSTTETAAESPATPHPSSASMTTTKASPRQVVASTTPAQPAFIIPSFKSNASSFSVDFAEHRIHQLEVTGLAAIIPNRTWNDIVHVCRPRVFNPAVTITPDGDPWLYARFLCFGRKNGITFNRCPPYSKIALKPCTSPVMKQTSFISRCPLNSKLACSAPLHVLPYPLQLQPASLNNVPNPVFKDYFGAEDARLHRMPDGRLIGVFNAPPIGPATGQLFR